MTKTSSNKTELRQRAEEKLSKRKKHPARETDALHLIHELEVHQIELEMQNEELAQARAEMEALLRQYTDLYDFAPVGYFTLAHDGTIRQVNLAGANLLGVERDKLIKRRLGAFVSIPSRPIFNAFLDEVFTGGGKAVCEIALVKPGPDSVSVHVEATIQDGQRGACLAAGWDISARKQAEEQLIYQGTHDALTGLYNRGFFMEEMARLERGREFPISIVMADVDRLKETNDREGHAAGDVLLQRIAQILTATFRAADIIARIGGDEFAVLLPATDASVAEASLQRVRQMILENNAADAGPPIRISFGVSTTEQSASLSNLLIRADVNMYREKRGHDALLKKVRPGGKPSRPHCAARRKKS